MNKRKLKKKRKKVRLFSRLEDVLDRCRMCENYEADDLGVGYIGGCFSDFLYDKEGEVIEKHDRIISQYMSCKGYTCPYFTKKLKAQNRTCSKGNLPKSYKEYKKRKKAIEDFYSTVD